MGENICIFCLEEKRDPYWVPCGHSFCTECFQQFLDLSTDNRCPICRTVIPPEVDHEDSVITINANGTTVTAVVNLENFRLSVEYTSNDQQ